MGPCEEEQQHFKFIRPGVFVKYILIVAEVVLVSNFKIIAQLPEEPEEQGVIGT